MDKHPVIMHINYCEQGQSIDDLCRKACKWGYDGVEFRRSRFYQGFTETPEEYLDSIARAMEASCLKFALFGYPTANLMNPDADQRKKELDEAVEFFDLAGKRFKLTVINAFSGNLLNADKSLDYSEYDKHGSAAATEDHYQWAGEGFKALGEIALQYGFKFAFETHMCYLHDLPSSVSKLVNMIDHPAVGVNLDYANIACFKDAPTLKDSIKMLGDKLFYVHLKNAVSIPGGGRLATGLSDGEINHREFMRLLIETNFEGPMCLEAPRDGDREWYAQEDINYFKSVYADAFHGR
jgi:sugar phosphate isomerase/epimerase